MTFQEMISKRLKPQEERQFHAAWLAKLGVPAQFCDTIVDHMPPNGLKKLIAYLSAYPIAFLAAIFIFVGLLTPLDALVTVHAAAVAAETGASLIHVDAGLSALVMVFGLFAFRRCECGQRHHACSNRGDRRQARKPDRIQTTIATGPQSAPSALPPPLGDAVRHRRRPPAGKAAARNRAVKNEWCP